jgi:hypothetical protein
MLNRTTSGQRRFTLLEGVGVSLVIGKVAAFAAPAINLRREKRLSNSISRWHWSR